MTVSARNWAWQVGRQDEQGNPTVFREKLTLLCLAELESAEEGCAFPSHQHLASMTGQSERTVRNHLRELELLGLVRVEKRRSDRGRWQRNVYVLNVPESFRASDKAWMGHQEGSWSRF